jgi:hypothetical protein
VDNQQVFPIFLIFYSTLLSYGEELIGIGKDFGDCTDYQVDINSNVDILGSEGKHFTKKQVSKCGIPISILIFLSIGLSSY